MKFGAIALMLVSVFLLLGCTAQPPGGPSGTPTPSPALVTSPIPSASFQPSVTPGDLGMAEANNKFAFDFFAKARETEAGNIFFSPFSMSEAFGILYEGAKGNTARELEAVFGFEPSETVRLGDFKKLNARLNSGSDAYKLSVANSLWIERTYGVYDNYEALARDFYGSEINDADFIRDPEGSRTTINKWVEGKTNNKIIDLLPKGSVSALTRLVIANAIYFKGTWVKEFNKENTREEEFRQGDGKTVKAQMMYRTDKDAVFRYMENEKLQALEMPYKGNDISMLVLLPQNDDIDGLERGLAAKDLEEWRKDMRSQRVDVIFPKFKFTQKYELNDHLKAMGVRDAFTAGKADLTGIEPKRELYVTGAYHKAFVEVNEEGTEAAAATGIVVGITAAMPPRIPEFRADHPFIFIIQETATGNILFMGKVVDPMQ